MAGRDFDAEKSGHKAKQASADAKIARHQGTIDHGVRGSKQDADDRQLMNEMRGNKASVDFNRALFDYDEEHKDDIKGEVREGTRKNSPD